MRVVIALGGNALLRRGEPPTVEAQRRNLERAARSVADVAREHEIVVTHGNGPQVGLLALQAESYTAVPPAPLDVLGAESEGMIGYLVEQQLRAHLPEREIATLLTQVVVDRDDPAFRAPTKPIGPLYSREEADRLARERAWTMAPVESGWRRVVPSPEPRRILELGVIRLLMSFGVLVVCTGGGGIPVALAPDGSVCGVQAVIDKDLAAALLAREIGAGALLLLTDVPGVYRDWSNSRVDLVARATPAELRAIALPAGSMGPKAEAACRFVEAGGTLAGIGSLEDARAMLEQRAGTRVVAGQI